jgi:hypothetical protein
MFPGSNVVNSEFRFRNSKLFSVFTAQYHKTLAFEVQIFQKFNSEIRTHKSELGRGKPPPDCSHMSSPHPFPSSPPIRPCSGQAPAGIHYPSWREFPCVFHHPLCGRSVAAPQRPGLEVMDLTDSHK